VGLFTQPKVYSTSSGPAAAPWARGLRPPDRRRPPYILYLGRFVVITLFDAQLADVVTFVTATVTAVWPVLLGAAALAMCVALGYTIVRRFRGASR